MFKLLTIVSMFKSNLLIGIKVIQIRHNHGKGTPPPRNQGNIYDFFSLSIKSRIYTSQT